MSAKKAQTLTHRVGGLEVRMARVEKQLEPLASLPEQVLELRTLLRSTLISQQERIDHLEAVLIDKFEEVFKLLKGHNASL